MAACLSACVCLLVHMYVKIHVCLLCVSMLFNVVVCTHTGTQLVFTHSCVCVCVCVCVCARARMEEGGRGPASGRAGCVVFAHVCNLRGSAFVSVSCIRICALMRLRTNIAYA
jgi:hypothetical protein